MLLIKINLTLIICFFFSQASKVQNQIEANKDVIPRETYEDEMEQMRREVQQCKEFIHAQQQLLQVRSINLMDSLVSLSFSF